MRLMVLDLPVPDHTQMSRRATQLPVTIPRKERQEPIHLVVDSTGLKIYSEGEWKVRQHGVGNRRTWGKVYLAVDGHAKDVIGVEVTTVDCEVFEELVGNSLASRLVETQINAVHARVAAMNVMTYLGMPVSVRVETILS